MKGGLRPLELRDYLKLEKRVIPWVYMNAIYNKLKIELLEEIESEQLSNLEDIQAAVDEYNDKWNAIRDEYIKVFNTDGAPLPIDYFKEHYWEEHDIYGNGQF